MRQKQALLAEARPHGQQQIMDRVYRNTSSVIYTR